MDGCFVNVAAEWGQHDQSVYPVTGFIPQHTLSLHYSKFVFEFKTYLCLQHVQKIVQIQQFNLIILLGLMPFNDSYYGLGRLIDILYMQKDGIFGLQFLSILGSILRDIY